MRDLGSVTPPALGDRLSAARHLSEAMLEHQATRWPTSQRETLDKAQQRMINTKPDKNHSTESWDK